LVAGVGCGVPVLEAELARGRLHPRGIGRQGLLRRAVSPPVVDGQDALWPSRDRVQAGVGGDSVEPPAKRASTVEIGQPPPGPKERVLKRVLGVLRRAEHAIAVREQRPSVDFDEVPKRVLVAVMGRFDELTLLYVHGALDPARPEDGSASWATPVLLPSVWRVVPQDAALRARTYTALRSNQ